MPDALLGTVADLAALVDETIAPDDAKALLLLRSASEVVRSQQVGTGQYISRVTDDVVRVTPRTSTTAFLSEFPIDSVSLLERRTYDGWVELEATAYSVNEETGRITLRSTPTTFAELWRITYTHGYAETPPGIAGVTAALAARYWETPIGVDNERIGQRSIKYLMLDSGFLPEEESVLQEYRRGRTS